LTPFAARSRAMSIGSAWRFCWCSSATALSSRACRSWSAGFVLRSTAITRPVDVRSPFAAGWHASGVESKRYGDEFRLIRQRFCVVLDTTAWVARGSARTLATVPARGQPHVASHVASYELRARLPELVDELGDPIAGHVLPCSQRPADWTSDAPAETRQRSARTCRCACPVLAQCDEMRVALGRDAHGVLAGIVLDKHRTHG
jgi:hypothetical protein